MLCPVLYAVRLASTAVMRRLDLGRDAAVGEAADRVLEYARNQPVLRAFGRTVEGYGALDEALVAEARADRRLIARGLPGLVSFSFATRLVFALLLALGVSWQLDGSLTVPTLLALLVLLVRLIDSVSSAAEAGAGMRIARNTLERLGAVLDEPPFPQPTEPREPRDASVEFEGVDFCYGTGAADGTGGRPVLCDVSFHLPERSMTALVGPSGAGKTTVAGLLARCWDTTGGTVRVGGVDVREIAADELAAHVSVVFQDVYLFDDTIEENVRIAAPDADPGELAAAAALSGLDRVIEELPDGWATKVGEGGARLSGGQRQRVSIARALLKNSPILVFDEATAALDQENEALFAEAVRTLAAHKTLLVIAHRLSTVVSADQIIVLEDGGITELGTHDDLVEAGGTYASFWERRVLAHGWRLEAARS